MITSGTPSRLISTSGRVVLADVNEQALQSATDGLTDAGHQAISAICDVSDEDQVAAVVDQAVARFGRVDMAALQPRRELRARGCPTGRWRLHRPLMNPPARTA